MLKKFGLIMAQASLALGLGTAAPMAAQAWDIVHIDGEVDVTLNGETDKVVAMGGDVRLAGFARGEVVAMGGNVSVDLVSERETALFGGNVEAVGQYAAELVMAGGEVLFGGTSSDASVFFGGVITIDEDALIGGTGVAYGGEVQLLGTFTEELSAVGGEVEAAGTFAGPVYLGGDEVTLSGTFAMDVEVEAVRVTIADDAMFSGSLLVRSPNEPDISPDYTLDPELYTYEYIKKVDPKIGDTRLSELRGAFVGIALGLAVFVLFFFLIALVIVVTAARVTTEAGYAFRYKPVQAGLIGLASAVAIGILGAILIIIAIGPLVALTLMMVGSLIGGYSLVALAFRKSGERVGFGARLGYTLLGILILLIIQVIPIIGGFAAFVISVMGLGAFGMALFGKAMDGPQALAAAPAMMDTPPEAYDDGHPPEPDFEIDEVDDLDEFEDDERR